MNKRHVLCSYQSLAIMYILFVYRLKMHYVHLVISLILEVIRA